MFVEAGPADDPAGVAARPPKTTSRRDEWWSRLRSSGVPLLYLLPAVVLLVVWVYKPLAETVGLSFYQWNMIPTTPKVPVGLDNYTTVLALPELHQALWNTVLYVLAFMVFSLVLPVGIALLCGQVTGRAKTFYQALIFVPFLITPVASSAIWRWLFTPESGTIPRVAATLGFEMGDVFRDPKVALLGVVVVVGWQMLGFGVLVISAGVAESTPTTGWPLPWTGPPNH